MKKLPDNWCEVSLGEISSTCSGIGFPLQFQGRTEGELGFYKVGDISRAVIEQGGFLKNPQHCVSKEIAIELKGKPIPSGATVFAKIGEAVKLNRRAFVVNECLVDNNVMAVKAFLSDSDRYIYMFLRTRDFTELSRATTVPSLRKDDIESLIIPLAPLNEQKRIADKLDSILTRVDACRERLDRIPAILKRFRQSVLAAATSGKLTEEWRGVSETIGWITIPLSDVCLSITDGDHQAPPQTETGIPFITISAINDGRLRLEKASRFVPQYYFEALKGNRRPNRGDILYSVTGSIGIPVLIDTDCAFTFQRHIAILKPDYSKITSNYLKYALEAKNTQKQALAAATGTAQLTIPLTGLRTFLIKVPFIEEQTEIVRRVEELFAYADRLEARYAATRAKADKLTSAILAKAFRGELVPQDPNDEPASVLLERIQKTLPATKQRGRSKTNPAAAS
ncbi:restriction endonuclease subunit S [Nitrosomonas ureae]|uniref:Type I restriction enzyme, S subunit n=1 Tax=Nitrosomonas ureae TaxID=44577 RepID=A0A1H5WJQ2_9PROT|nr:restriction endonuclease subunit S [Nitrosomonas ureae]SEF99573.1 type I restriction enzyme, S subunit [Nitrosomonas ureae]